MEDEVTYDVMKCGKCGGTHGIVQECPPQRDEATIKFTCAVWKVSTLADGGIRLVLDLQESAREHMPELARCQQNDIALEIKAKKTN